MRLTLREGIVTWVYTKAGEIRGWPRVLSISIVGRWYIICTKRCSSRLCCSICVAPSRWRSIRWGICIGLITIWVLMYSTLAICAIVANISNRFHIYRIHRHSSVPWIIVVLWAIAHQHVIYSHTIIHWIDRKVIAMVISLTRAITRDNQIDINL